MSTERLPLCWIDLETTGLGHHDPILEVACILTDPVMDRELGSYQQVVNPDLHPRGYDGHVRYPGPRGGATWTTWWCRCTAPTA